MLANNSLLLRDRSFYEKYSFLFVPAVIETMTQAETSLELDSFGTIDSL